MLITLAALLLGLTASRPPTTIALDNGVVRRELAFDGSAWRTVAFARSGGSDRLAVRSDELHLLMFDDTTLTIGDYEADGVPRRELHGPEAALVVRYRRQERRTYPASAPTAVEIRYLARDGEPYLRKQIQLTMPPEAEIDRLEVERFTTGASAVGGGRGEPVFLGDRWFVGVEYPAAHARHTDGNTPRAGSRRYDEVGNYSRIDLDGRDVEPKARPGLVRLMHFPGRARPGEDRTGSITSKTAVAGVGDGAPMPIVFGNYLAAIRRAPRSFLNYNNWFDRDAKDLRGDRLVDVVRAFREVLDPAGIRLDAVVPDDGWQDKRTLYEPAATHFPNGLPDVAALGRALRGSGTSLGLWLALSGYNQAPPETFPRAQPCPYFARFKHSYPLAHTPFRDALGAQLRKLIRSGELSYLKHDFNPLCDVAPDRGHPATQRHGHEAELDAMLDLMALERAENPSLYLNVTNWVWFSPWWLMHADALWMLAGDDGFNGNWPELAGRAMATTDRDTYLWRMWGDVRDRPLVPISALMTHGIIRNAQGQMQNPDDTIADWADHVVMHYGRGVQLKEWYISPKSMSADEWKALTQMHRYSERRAAALVNAVFVGGRPDEGHVYGYVGWDGDSGVLVTRNPNPREQTLRVPISAETLYRGDSRGAFRSRVLYPYRGDGPGGGDGVFEVAVPGYATMVLEIERGKGGAPSRPLPPPGVERRADGVTVDVPDEAMARNELIVIGYSKLPEVTVAGKVAAPQRSGTGEPNHFASYARAGMDSGTARPWRMASYDLTALRGQRVEIRFGDVPESGSFEAFWLLDRPVGASVGGDRGKGTSVEAGRTVDPWAIADGYRRQTIELRAERGSVPKM
jgi:hypothetical protein